MLLGKSNQIEIVPLPVARNCSKWRSPGAVQVRRDKLHPAPMREQTQQPQRLGCRVQRRQQLILRPAGPAQDLQQGQLRWRSKRKRTPRKKTMSPVMVFMPRDHKCRQRIRVKQVDHPSASIAATSSAVIFIPSSRASGIPCRCLNFVSCRRAKGRFPT